MSHIRNKAGWPLSTKSTIRTSVLLERSGATGVLPKRAFPRQGRRQQQAVQRRVVEALADRRAGGQQHTRRFLRQGIERFLITDINNPAASNEAASMVPVLWDHVSARVDAFSHVPGGCNVLYLDGHVDFLRYPAERFPVTRNSAYIFGRYNRCFDGF